VGARADLCAIELLAAAYPDACEVQDEDGKTPLHLACDSSCRLFEDDRHDRPREPPCIRLVSMLSIACPRAVPLEDNDGINAIEYAILSGSSLRVVKFLQEATRKQCERQCQHVLSLKTNDNESTATW
jgi:ankyrin repeat protein